MGISKNLFKTSAIIDNNILIDFFEIGQLDLLFEVFDHVGIPKIIYDREIDEIIKEALKHYRFDINIMTTVEALETYAKLTSEQKFKRLSDCDKIAVSISKEFNCYCSSNDGPIRKACQILSIDNVGSLGIIGCAFENDLINQQDFILLVGKLLSDETSCYIRKNIVSDFLANYQLSIQ
ncbi:MAG: hypothetical protein JEZ08_13225 [Clostridiales bacterium]|nr:hypothetical protein [Clostridiales bacterium]